METTIAPSFTPIRTQSSECGFAGTNPAKTTSKQRISEGKIIRTKKSTVVGVYEEITASATALERMTLPQKATEPKFAASDPLGTAAAPVVVRVPTYQGPDCNKMDFAEPLVPVTVENKCGMVLTLGEKSGDKPVPEIVCERRKNGWCIFMGPQAGGDHNVSVYFIDREDDPETIAVFDWSSNKFPEVMKEVPKEMDELPRDVHAICRKGAKS